MPAADESEAPARTERKAEGAGGGDPGPGAFRILVAEDNPVNQMVAMRLLKKLGHHADVARNGREALDALSESGYDLVLMDCQMPEMDGYEATAEIRRRERGAARRTPIVVMTAHAMQGDRERCLAAGMDDYLSKPVKGDELQKTLERWLRVPGSPDRAAQTDDECFGPSAIESLKEVLADEDFLSEVINLYLEDTPALIASLRESLSAGDLAGAGRIAHSIKGSSANVGAVRLSALGAELEMECRQARAGACDAALPKIEEEFSRVSRAMQRLLPAHV